jgi:hypothetical protein
LLASASSLSDCRCFFLIINVLKRRLTVMQTLQVQDGLCFGPLPLGGWIHTMQVQPGRCRGCLVVVATEATPWFPTSPKTAAVAKASRLDGSISEMFCFRKILLFRLLISVAVVSFLNYVRLQNCQ